MNRRFRVRALSLSVCKFAGVCQRSGRYKPGSAVPAADGDLPARHGPLSGRPTNVSAHSGYSPGCGWFCRKHQFTLTCRQKVLALSLAHQPKLSSPRTRVPSPHWRQSGLRTPQRYRRSTRLLLLKLARYLQLTCVFCVKHVVNLILSEIYQWISFYFDSSKMRQTKIKWWYEQSTVLTCSCQQSNRSQHALLRSTAVFKNGVWSIVGTCASAWLIIGNISLIWLILFRGINLTEFQPRNTPHCVLILMQCLGIYQFNINVTINNVSIRGLKIGGVSV